jgi:hypothetical protein
VINVAKGLYVELSKHAHGNVSTSELILDQSKHAMTEVAAIESIFCALKKKGCFHIPMTIHLK